MSIINTYHPAKIIEINYNSQLLATGQKTSYYKGDDGDLKFGTIKDFTILDKLPQHVDTTKIIINDKTHNLSNNCVQDNNTNLMWARYVPQKDIGSGSDGKLFWVHWELEGKTFSFNSDQREIRDSSKKFNTEALCKGRKFIIKGSDHNDRSFTVDSSAEDIIKVKEKVLDEKEGAAIVIITEGDLIWDFVDQANSNELGGYNNWHIPNYIELLSIVNIELYNPCINSLVFPSTPGSYFWTSSTRPGDPLRAFYVNFYNSYINTFYKNRSQCYIRLVRKTQEF